MEKSFSEMQSAGIWKDREESVDEILEELGMGWRGFAQAYPEYDDSLVLFCSGDITERWIDARD